MLNLQEVAKLRPVCPHDHGLTYCSPGAQPNVKFFWPQAGPTLFGDKTKGAELQAFEYRHVVHELVVPIWRTVLNMDVKVSSHGFPDRVSYVFWSGKGSNRLWLYIFVHRWIDQNPTNSTCFFC